MMTEIRENSEPAVRGLLDRFFRLSENGTGIRTEILAGVTTYLTMAYIIFVNPAILAGAGMDFGAVFVATCLAAAISTAIMGLYANYPVALAPGMGLNAYFAFVAVPQFGGDWRTALGCVFLSGVLFLALSLSPLREWLINSIPRSQKSAIAAGIGFFLALIGLKNAGIVVADPATLVTLGKFSAPALFAAGGFVVLAGLAARRIPGAIIISVLGVTALAVLFGMQPFEGVAATPPSLAPTFMQMDLAKAVQAGFVTIVFVFLLVDLLDTAGTLVSVAARANMLDADGKLPRLRKAMVADSAATIVGAMLGTSTTTSYIESAAGVNAGGRTGLTALVVALLFLASLFLAPLAHAVPIYATAPALLFVACLMARGLAEIEWDDMTEAVPAVVTALAIPLTFSIASGIGLGFLAYAAIKIIAGRPREAGGSVVFIALAFALKLALE
ncbi:NCS2 family permease [Parvibaculum sp.]|uniref:NCS2 family permease n=1 Tax=Parvibaculum sp. TaxID=2024848 RepID=UPI0025D286AA|nr:NCS2 family permease [Parvibaculum sp.]